MTCKYMSDDEQDICCNGECPLVADFCPWVDFEDGCRYSEEKEREQK